MTTNGSYDWSDEPPPRDQRKYVPIYSPVPGQVLKLVILSDGILGVWTHFLDQRTIPCIRPENGCACARLDLARRWKGYLGCFDPAVGRVVLAEITLGAYNEIAAEAAVLSSRLRGRYLRLTRAGQSVRARVSASLDTRLDLPEEFTLPPAPDVRECLKRIWGVMPGK